jgi:hypothetical protein
LPEIDFEEIILRIKAKQFPNFNDLTELEYIYYSVGFFYIDGETEKMKCETISSGFKETFKMFEFLSYETADLKTLLFDISSCVRGIGGAKKTFNPKDLPSNGRDRKIKEEAEQKAIENETPEERRARQRRFFEELKRTFKQ